MPEDFLGLVQFMGRSAIITTPTILAEVSNLIRPRNGESRAVMEMYRRFVAHSEENYTPSTELVSKLEIGWLGLTDVDILSQPDDCRVLTCDAMLYSSLVSKGRDAINFNHLRERWLSP